VKTAHYRLAQCLLKVGQVEAGQKELRLASQLKAEAFKMAQTLGTGPTTMGTSQLPEQDDKLSATGSIDNTTTASNLPDEKAMRELERTEAYSAKVLAAPRCAVSACCERIEGTAWRRSSLPGGELNPQQPDVDYNLGLAYFRAESYKDAGFAAETEAKNHPQNIPARWFRFELPGPPDYSRASKLLADVIASRINQR
jgi:hypothetical protein